MLHSKNKIMVWKTSALNGQVCGIDYITGQSTVPKFGKQIDTVIFSRTTCSSEIECHVS